LEEKTAQLHFNLKKLRCHLALHKIKLKNNSLPSSLPLKETRRRDKSWPHISYPSYSSQHSHFSWVREPIRYQILNRLLDSESFLASYLPYLLGSGPIYASSWVNTLAFLMVGSSLLSKAAPSTTDEHTLFPSPMLVSVHL
jgi:hypothetical protein